MCEKGCLTDEKFNSLDVDNYFCLNGKMVYKHDIQNFPPAVGARIIVNFETPLTIIDVLAGNTVDLEISDDDYCAIGQCKIIIRNTEKVGPGGGNNSFTIRRGLVGAVTNIVNHDYTSNYLRIIKIGDNSFSCNGRILL